jgi:acyl-CoA synthetase (NDP forming)
MRLVGPTCLGVMVPHASLNATIAGAMARPGRVAFLSQSGALCSAILDWSLREGVGFSAFVSVGGMADVGWGDLIDHLGDDPHTQSIVIYLESIGDARAFLSAARAVSFTKPIVVIKPGRTEAAARAAAQHTGALTGDDAVLDAAFQRAGVLRVDTLEEVFDMAEVFGKQPRPRGPRLAIVTNAGGPAAIAADSLVLAGGQLAPLATETFAALGRPVPPSDQRAAPLDLLGDADAARYRTAVAAVAADPACDGVLVILTPQAVTDATAVATRLKELLPLAGGKPFLAAWMGGAAVDAGEAVLNAAGIPTFKYSDRAARAFAHLWRYSTHLQSLYETPQLFEDAQGRRVPGEAAAAVLRAARQKRRTSLESGEIARLLGAYGLTPALPVEADTETQVVAAARAAGFPARLVPRLEDAAAASPVVVRDAAGVRLAWRTLKRAAEATAGKGGFGGVWVSRVLPEPGIDLQLGSRIDPQFGPVLTFGAGGWLGELAPDVAVGLPPLNSTLALRLMEQTRIFRALRAGRGLPGVDLTPLEQGVVRFSQLVAAQPWLRAVRLDPVRLTAAGLVVTGAEVIAARSRTARGGTAHVGHPSVSTTVCHDGDAARRHAGAAAADPARGRADDGAVSRDALRSQRVLPLLPRDLARTPGQPRPPRAALLRRLRPGDGPGHDPPGPGLRPRGDHRGGAALPGAGPAAGGVCDRDFRLVAGAGPRHAIAQPPRGNRAQGRVAPHHGHHSGGQCGDAARERKGRLHRAAQPRRRVRGGDRPVAGAAGFVAHGTGRPEIGLTPAGGRLAPGARKRRRGAPTDGLTGGRRPAHFARWRNGSSWTVSIWRTAAFMRCPS